MLIQGLHVSYMLLRRLTQGPVVRRLLHHRKVQGQPFSMELSYWGLLYNRLWVQMQTNRLYNVQQAQQMALQSCTSLMQ